VESKIIEPPPAEISGFAFKVRAEFPTWLISPTYVFKFILSFPPAVCAVKRPLSYMVACEPSAETILPDKRDWAYALVTYSWSWKLLVAVSFLTSLAESGIYTC
jgi:hypothetical protein